MPNQSTRNPSGDALRADASQGHGVRRVGAPGSQLGTAAEEARWDRTSHRALHCPSWDRTRTLLIQSQACCQLHQGAEITPTQCFMSVLEADKIKGVQEKCARLKFMRAFLSAHDHPPLRPR